MAAFFLGEDNRVGTFYFVVIRTTNQCFFRNGKTGTGLVLIDCESIKKIPAIKTYLDKGKRP